MKKTTVREATEQWISRDFSYVPGSVIEKMADADENIRLFDSDSFRLVASPRVECAYCSASFDGDQSLGELEAAQAIGKGVACPYCSDNDGNDWITGWPRYAFPCGGGTLFAPKQRLDIEWILENRDDVAKLGIFVFESDDWRVLLGIDAGGFDFYEAYWLPLYRLRGLQWHNAE